MKRYLPIALAVLVSLVIWLIANLSETTSDIVSVRVVAHSNIVGYSNTSGESVTIAAAVSGSGFSLLRLAFSKNKEVDVYFDPLDLIHKEGDFFLISDNSLFKYASSLFGANVSVKSFLSHSVSFRFLKENYKKVPIIPVDFISCKDQYMPLSEIQISHDSVYIYADPVRLENINKVFTKQINHKDVDQSVHGVIELDTPAGTRLSIKEVTYSQDITRYIEYTSIEPVQIRNLPPGKSLNIYPAAVKVTYNFAFPLSGNPAHNTVLYIDYQEFVNSLNGDCMVRAENLSDMTISWTCSPQMCNCVETLQ